MKTFTLLLTVLLAMPAFAIESDGLTDKAMQQYIIRENDLAKCFPMKKPASELEGQELTAYMRYTNAQLYEFFGDETAIAIIEGRLSSMFNHFYEHNKKKVGEKNTIKNKKRDCAKLSEHLRKMVETY